MPAPRSKNKAPRPAVTYEECWAKTTADGLPGIGVADHCRNVGYVARAFLDAMPPRVRELLPDGTVALAAAHDIGKVSPEFQVQCPVWRETHRLQRGLLKGDHAA
jgi:CRISPR-associated endonuclease/helicase Cas3